MNFTTQYTDVMFNGLNRVVWVYILRFCHIIY